MALPTIDALLAEQELLDLVARFDDAVIRTDLTAFGDLWTDDATWEIGEPLPLLARGRDEIVAALNAFKEQNLFFFRLTARPVMTIGQNRAMLRSPTIELAGRAGNQAYANVALYQDEAVKSEKGWRFQWRRYDYVWVNTQSRLEGETVPLASDIAASIAAE